MGLTTEHLAILIEANAGKAIAEFKKVGAAAKGLEGQAAGGTKALGGLGQIGATAGNLLKGSLAVGATVAAGALVKFATDAVGSFTTLAASVRDVQRITGGTAEEASKLVAILDDFEVPVEVLNKGFFRLAREIGKNDKAFAEAGFSVARNAKGNVDLSATLLNIADAYNATEDSAKRATLLTAAFGRGGAELIPILEQGRAGIEAVFSEAGKVGQILSQDDLDKAEEFRLAIDDLHDATGQLAIEIGSGLVPALSKVAKTVTDAISGIKQLNDRLEETRGRVQGFIEDTAEKSGGLKGAVQTLGDAFTSGSPGGFFDTIIHGKDALDEADASAQGAADGLGDLDEATEEAARKVAQADKDLDTLTKTLFSAESASRALADAQESLDDAHQKLTDATDNYNKLLKDGAVDEEKVADARRSLAEASRSAADADRGLAKARKEYNEAKAAADILGTDTANDKLADAAEGLADAQDSAASAHERAAEAAENLREAQAGDPEFQKKLAAARREVEDATEGIADAEFQLGQRSYENVIAHRAEEEALSDKADQLERLRDDLDAILKLHPEQLSFLGPILAGLPASGQGAPASPLAGGGLLPGVFGPGGLMTSAPAAAPVTTNNVTINATTSEADARLIAKEVMWNLN